MALLNKLKSLFGLDDGRSGSDRQSTDDVGVTVEREPGATEPADEEAPPATPAPGTEAADPEPANESEPEPEPDINPESAPDREPDSEPSTESGVDPEVDTPPAETEDDGPLVDSESEPIETVEPEPEIGDGADETEPDATDSPTDDAEPSDEGALREIKGIGPSYATKLSEAGVDSPGDLAAADAEELSATTGLSEKRIQGWIDRAQDR
jgi:predicted flap endonuclease-1-like 5' DNA nuclease